MAVDVEYANEMFQHSRYDYFYFIFGLFYKYSGRCCFTKTVARILHFFDPLTCDAFCMEKVAAYGCALSMLQRPEFKLTVRKNNSVDVVKKIILIWIKMFTCLVDELKVNEFCLKWQKKAMQRICHSSFFEILDVTSRRLHFLIVLPPILTHTSHLRRVTQ